MKRFEDMTLPLLELREEYDTYSLIGKFEIADKILDAITKEDKLLRRSTRAS